MKLQYITTLPLLVAASVSATSYNTTFGPGAGDARNSTLWENVNQSPNATASKNFDLIYDQGTQDPQWTWTINVTEIPVTDANSSDARVVNTVYSFEWPEYDSSDFQELLNQGNGVALEGGNIRDALDAEIKTAKEDGYLSQDTQSNVSFCITAVRGLFPANVTNAFNASSRSGCADVLGVQCVNAIGREFTLNSETDEQGCRGSDVNMAKIPECKGTFDEDEFASETIRLDTASSNSSIPTNGSGFYHFTSKAFTPASSINFTAIEEARLHMIVVNTASWDTLCLRVNPNVMATDDANTGGASSQQGVASGLARSVWAVGLGVAVVLVMSVM